MLELPSLLGRREAEDEEMEVILREEVILTLLSVLVPSACVNGRIEVWEWRERERREGEGGGTSI